MYDARYIALTATATIVLIGTVYSIIHNTYLDTSNPLLTNLPHPLHKSHYFASKSNVLNVHFIKRIWGWTSAAFLALLLTSPESSAALRPRRVRVLQFITATSVWLAFTSWFFGPSVLDRLISSTGGQCLLSLPSGELVSVPFEHCYAHTWLSPSSHPTLFTEAILDKDWRGHARLRRGHDVSGHVFLLTMSVLFLVDQLRVSFRTRSTWTTVHRVTVTFAATVIALSLFSMWNTSVYFHTPFEKFTGYRQSDSPEFFTRANRCDSRSSWCCWLWFNPDAGSRGHTQDYRDSTSVGMNSVISIIMRYV